MTNYCMELSIFWFNDLLQSLKPSEHMKPRDAFLYFHLSNNQWLEFSFVSLCNTEEKKFDVDKMECGSLIYAG